MEDPFASLFKNCNITASQREELGTCPFARESEVFPELSEDSLSASPTPASSEPTVIEMVSLPDSVSGEIEEFQTPPEHANSSSQPYLSGSEDLRPPPPLAAHTVAAALGSQSDSPTANQATATNEGGAEHRGIVDLGTDCDDLGFSEPHVTNSEISAPDGSDSANSANGSEDCEDDFNDSESFKGNNEEHVSKRIRVSENDLGVDGPTLYIGETEPVNNDVIDLECEESKENEKIMLDLDFSANGGKFCVDESKKMEDTEEQAPVNSIDKAANEKGEDDDVASGEEDHNDVANREVGRRELPLSIKGGERSIGEKKETEKKVDSKNRSSFKDLMADVEELFGLGKPDYGGNDGSLLEAAEKCGWVFPTPSWWPPEGFDD